jgi:CRP-like cAMP-binding protein
MPSAKKLLDFINKFIMLSQDEYDSILAPHLKVRNFEKKEVITHTGEVEDYFNFITSGLVRKYFKKGKEEINTQISMEGHIIHAQESFHSRKPSEYTVEAIEPSSLISITYNDLENVYASSGKMEHMGRLIVTATMVIKDNWQMQQIKHTPRERFILFINKNPELVQRVPQKYLATFLNIKPETFSRFKHLIKEHRSVKLIS